MSPSRGSVTRCLQERLTAVDGEAHLLALGLGRGGQLRLRRGLPHLRLGELAERELETRQHVRGHGPQHVRLVLRAVEAARHEGLAVAPHEARVVARGDARQAELVGQLHKGAQAHRVTDDAGVGRARPPGSSPRTARPPRARSASPDPRGGKGTPTAAAVCRARCMAPGEQQLRRSSPGHKLHRRGLERAALLDQAQRRHARVDAAAQCDECSCFFGRALRMSATSPSRPFLTR